MKKRKFLLLMASVAILACANITSAYAQIAGAKYDKGASDTEIKIGNTAPYSGPASVFASFSKVIKAYFDAVNENGGINGRKINFISLDDGFNTSFAVQQTRKLVEEEGVLLIFNSLGTETGLAVRSYLNKNKVPQLFQGSGSALFNNPSQYPYSFPGLPDIGYEVSLYVKHAIKTNPDAKIALLRFRGTAGAEMEKAARKTLKDLGKEGAIVNVQQVDDASISITPQMLAMKESGANVLINYTLPRQAIQSIQELDSIDWHPVHYMAIFSASRELIFDAAGFEKSKGIISTKAIKDPKDPQWDSVPEMQAYKTFMAKYVPDERVNDENFAAAWAYSSALALILKACGDDLTHENILKVAQNFQQSSENSLILPGLQSKIAPTDYRFFKKLYLAQFDGSLWKTLE